MGHVLLVLSFLFVAACAPTLQQQREEGLAAATNDLERGLVYYRTSCNRCHALYMPRSFTMAEWPGLVKRYGPRARLTNKQRDLVIDYLVTNALDAPK